MTHLSEHDLWGTGGNRVVVLPPTEGDVFVAIAIGGSAAVLWPVNEYDRAVEVAQRFTRRLRTAQPVTIKVLCVTLAEAQRFGFVPTGTMPSQTPQEDAEDRQFVIRTLWAIVLNSNEAKPRADALDLLKQLGATT